MAEVWLADDDRSVRFVLAQALREAGHQARQFGDADTLFTALATSVPDVIVTDVRMPGTSGLQLLERCKADRPGVPIIVMSAFTDISSTAAAYRHGAFDYLAKPFDLDEAVAAVERAVAENHPLPAPTLPRTPTPKTELIGQSPPMREVFRAIGRVAGTELNVLITGETGTGKELVARALHGHSGRHSKPFVALNTAAIPAELLESELFGHEAGAFTGALKRHAGRFEQAEGGTLFLDEIGDMPLNLQTRLLRVLAEGEFYRVGGRELIKTSVRVIAATHQDLDGKVARGEFRADLLHRLDVVRIHLPPLRERREDIGGMAERFIVRAAEAMRLEPKRFSPKALAALVDQPWPGNVRQLENLCRRLAVMAPGREIKPTDLALPPTAGAIGTTPTTDWTEQLRRWATDELKRGTSGLYAHAREQLEHVLLDAALTLHGGHRQRAAQQLGLGRNTVTRKLGSSRSPKPKR
jgi:two-component system, NtrC family, nitrogen regulation response regulator GlnG